MHKEGITNDWGMFMGLNLILLPLRGFPSESDGATLALRLAECAGSKITIIHSTETETLSEAFLGLKKRIEQIAERVNVPVECVVQVSKSPKHDIVNMIKEIKPSLTIMATRHEKGFPAAMKESISQFVVKNSPQPLLIVHSLLGDFDSYRELEVERLMLLLQEGDTLDDSVVKLGIGITCKPIARSDLIGLHIVTISDKIPLTEFQTDAEFQKQEKLFLQQLGQYSQLSGVVLRPKVVLGHSYGKSTTYAARVENADLLLMGVREKLTSWLPWRRGLEHTQMYQIAKAAPCTVAFYFAKK